VPRTSNFGQVFYLDRAQNLIKLVSRNTAGEEANGNSTYPSVSGSGEFVAFTSDATNLTVNDRNSKSDVFSVKVATGETTLISRGLDGTPANGTSYSYFPAISADGRLVVFNSDANNIYDGNSPTWNVYVFDTRTLQTRLVSRATNGTPGNGPSLHGVISGNGEFVAFHSRATNLVSEPSNGVPQIYLHNLATGETRLISKTPGGAAGNGRSERASISENGRRVSFSSDATDLVVGDSNGVEDVFVYDQDSDRLIRVSVASGGGELRQIAGAPAMDRKSVISPDGTAVAFRSGGGELIPGQAASNVDIFLHTIATTQTERISNWPSGGQIAGDSEHHAVNYDASVVAFSVQVPLPSPGAAVQSFGATGQPSITLPTPGRSAISLGFVRDRRSGVTMPLGGN